MFLPDDRRTLTSRRSKWARHARAMGPLVVGVLWAAVATAFPAAPAGPAFPAQEAPLASNARAHAAPPRGYEVLEQDGWAWAIPTGSESPHERLTSLIDERLSSMRLRLGRSGNMKPLVVRTPDRGAFRKVTVEFGGGDPDQWVAALAFPSSGIVVLDAQRLASQTLMRGEIVAHELAHVVLGEAGPNIPRWYHEGVAQWLAGERLEMEWVRLLARFASDDALYRFAELTHFPPESQRESSIFYAQCHLFVVHLNERFGEPVHARLLDQLTAGIPFDSAFEKATGQPLAEVENAWREALALKHTWWSFAVGGISFFQAVAMLAIVAFVVQRARRRRALARMTEREMGEVLDPRTYGAEVPMTEPGPVPFGGGPEPLGPDGESRSGPTDSRAG